MPLTPFHMGVGLLCKGASPERFSLSAFAVVQVAVDMEVIWHLARGHAQIHALLHTLLGATVLGLLMILPAKRLITAFNGWARQKLGRDLGDGSWIVRRLEPLSFTAASTGCLVGAATHVGLDALVHGDMTPLWPVRDENPFLIPGSFETVHLICAMAGAMGFFLWWSRTRRS